MTSKKCPVKKTTMQIARIHWSENNVATYGLLNRGFMTLKKCPGKNTTMHVEIIHWSENNAAKIEYLWH